MPDNIVIRGISHVVWSLPWAIACAYGSAQVFSLFLAFNWGIPYDFEPDHINREEFIYSAFIGAGLSIMLMCLELSFSTEHKHEYKDGTFSFYRLSIVFRKTLVIAAVVCMFLYPFSHHAVAVHLNVLFNPYFEPLLLYVLAWSFTIAWLFEYFGVHLSDLTNLSPGLYTLRKNRKSAVAAGLFYFYSIIFNSAFMYVITSIVIVLLVTFDLDFDPPDFLRVLFSVFIAVAIATMDFTDDWSEWKFQRKKRAKEDKLRKMRPVGH